MKWFKAQNLDELKAEYRKLAKLHHPDMGGNLQDMQEINAEYDELSKRFAQGEYEEPEDAYTAYTEAEKFRDVILALLRFGGITIELCGRWLWVSGDTKPAKEILKENGFYLASKKSMWYWHAPEDGSHNRHHAWDIDKIRETYGSRIIRQNSDDLATA